MKLDIGGGTGFAAQFYLNRFNPDVNVFTLCGSEDPETCKMYFYDDSDENWDGCSIHYETLHKWSVWNIYSDEWCPLENLPPKPSGVWAGIGSTKLSAKGKEAIKNVLNQKCESCNLCKVL